MADKERCDICGGTNFDELYDCVKIEEHIRASERAAVLREVREAVEMAWEDVSRDSNAALYGLYVMVQEGGRFAPKETT